MGYQARRNYWEKTKFKNKGGESLKEIFGKVLILFLYYVVVGIASIFTRILGIDPFKAKDEGNTYWRPVSKEKPVHTISEL